MTLSEFYSLPEDERHAIMLDVARRATEAQLKLLKDTEEKDNDQSNT